jgi:hypothetical protein
MGAFLLPRNGPAGSTKEALKGAFYVEGKE